MFEKFKKTTICQVVSVFLVIFAVLYLIYIAYRKLSPAKWRALRSDENVENFIDDNAPIAESADMNRSQENQTTDNIDQFFKGQLVKKIDKLETTNKDNIAYAATLDGEQRDRLNEIIAKKEKEIAKLQNILGKVSSRLTPIVTEQKARIDALKEVVDKPLQTQQPQTEQPQTQQPQTQQPQTEQPQTQQPQTQQPEQDSTKTRDEKNDDDDKDLVRGCVENYTKSRGLCESPLAYFPNSSNGSVKYSDFDIAYRPYKKSQIIEPPKPYSVIPLYSRNEVISY